MNKKIIDLLTKNPHVQCPKIDAVSDILTNVDIVDIVRGSGLARKRLDNLEESYREWIKDIVDVSEFPHFYIVNGVTDALNQWIATEDRNWQYLEGDYEYAHMISGKGNKVTEYNNTDVIYVSNPTCATGNLTDISHLKNPVILDCAYIGSTAKERIVLPENTEQIWFSFSKGWGIIGQRIGVVFTKEPHKSLSLMKGVEAWNYTNVDIAQEIVDKFSIDTTYKMFKQKQLDICDKYNLTASDCFFIANSEDDKFAIRRRSGTVARLDISRLLLR